MPPARLDSLRGHGLAQYVMVEARDHYRVVLAIVEFADDFTSRRVILTRAADGQPLGWEEGPCRVVMDGELRPREWVRQVPARRLRAAPE